MVRSKKFHGDVTDVRAHDLFSATLVTHPAGANREFETQRPCSDPGEVSGGRFSFISEPGCIALSHIRNMKVSFFRASAGY